MPEVFHLDEEEVCIEVGNDVVTVSDDDITFTYEKMFIGTLDEAMEAHPTRFIFSTDDPNKQKVMIEYKTTIKEICENVK